jgi:glutamyl-tRNA reductase
MPLVILHRPLDESGAMPGPLVWRTCLREVLFVADDASPDARAERLVEGEAYRRLLEILCGLQSPLLGETQVMGQFKTFLGTLGPDAAWLSRLGQRLLADARDVRTEHLSGLGSRSYGSAIRRDLTDCTHAALIGTGKLANEVLPFLTDDHRSVDHWGRAREADMSGLKTAVYRTLDEVEMTPICGLPAALVVAAPAQSGLIEQVAGRYSSLRRVIDLRAEAGSRPIAVSAPVVSLQDLFERVRAADTSSAPKIEAARADIVWRSQQYTLRDELRPFGWDDLCA